MTKSGTTRLASACIVAALLVVAPGCYASHRLPEHDLGSPVDLGPPLDLDPPIDLGPLGCTTSAECATMEVCTDRVCACAPSATRCDGRCTDFTSDPMNCGACGIHVGEACASGVGECERRGVFSSCVAGTLACDAVPGMPIRESCNGVDDDCDGSVDDGCIVTGLAASSAHTCARRAGGDVVCWGRNYDGELGDGDYAGRLAPTFVYGLVDAVELEAGHAHTCARRSAGDVVCWGRNWNGELGDGTRTHHVTPTLVTGLTGAVELSVGGGHTCARRSSGEVVCWGNNGYGQLGDGTTSYRLAPTLVTGLRDAVELSAGSNHTCARRRAGDVVCWGNNSYGQLGDGTTTNRLTPTPVDGLTNAVELAAGGMFGEYDEFAHTCARRSSGDVVCWGNNDSGQLGDGTTTERLTPTRVTDLSDAAEVSAGARHTCARRASGAVVCWGSNDWSQLGDGTDGLDARRLTPTPVYGLTDAVEVSAGTYHTCARLTSGAVACWGSNSWGELGDGTVSTRLTPTSVVGL